MREARGGAGGVLALCIVEAEGPAAALATARTVCREGGVARVVRIPAHVTIDGADLGRPITREEAAALCERLEVQLHQPSGHGHSFHS